MKPIIIILLMIPFIAQSQDGIKYPVFNYKGMGLAPYITSYFCDKFVTWEFSNSINGHGLIFIEFKVDTNGNVNEIKTMESLTNCKKTPDTLVRNIEKTLLTTSSHWITGVEDFKLNENQYFLLPIIYRFGKKQKSCKKERGWHVSFRSIDQALKGIEYKQLDEIYIFDN